MFKVVSFETEKAKRRQGTIESRVPFVLDGQRFEVAKKIVNGEMSIPRWTKPVGEMLSLGSAESYKELLGKVTLDVELGREKVPLLYKEIYELVSDPNLPELLDPKWALSGTVIFAEHMEGQEVKFGSVRAEQGPAARVVTYSAGFEYTKQMIDFNRTFEIDILNRGMGEGYNALLNHIHLSPIVSYAYKPANKTAYQGKDGEERWVSIWRTLDAAGSAAGTAKRQGSVLLANSADRNAIETALKGFTYNGTTYAAISGITTVIYYDGYSVTVGKKEYSYAGVAPGKAYLIRPKRGFKELLKRDLQIETTQGDLTRLVQAEMIGYAYRGVYAAVEENVQEIALQ
ncbi:aspartate ammonia-lyase [Paenibacillus macerans]|uniref:hypothetical protein n=1 Tax=Paenibacillus macerans TaxID=44252 RepID=UPI001F0E2648|nr:hypothetical protein [Paenibacillus macerans]MDU5945455.1 aspartate ammonia-lyase [Paenibacillus macerans]MEC0139202.1 aspartate ammonia-lyase [Paenibacillus macerans]UMV47283.1 aspartate ammonia-lyase [Paenibacillus macerans]